MTVRAVRSVLLAVAWLSQLAAANAEETLLGMIRAHPECRQFDDGCSICRVENGSASCSTPGIACIQKGWACADPGSAASPQAGIDLAKAASVGLAGAIGRLAARPARP